MLLPVLLAGGVCQDEGACATYRNAESWGTACGEPGGACPAPATARAIMIAPRRRFLGRSAGRATRRRRRG
jgi:hypothetical protein